MTVRAWIKRRENPVADFVYRAIKSSRGMQVPVVAPVHLPLYHLRKLALQGVHDARRVLWWSPLFQARLSRPAPRLNVFTGIPQVLGPLEIEFGPDCSISGQTTLIGRSASSVTPRLVVGAGSDIGWQTTVAVGTRVTIGDGVLIAARCFLAGFPGHPLDPGKRRLKLPDTDDQVGDIVLEDDVWLATGVTVLAGVRIGKGTIVTAGSVVMRDLPPGVIATGNPARPVGPAPLAADAARPQPRPEKHP